MPVIADPSGKLHDIPDDVFAERMAEVCKGYEMPEEEAAEYLRREQDLLQKLQSESSQDDEEVKAYMATAEKAWDAVCSFVPKPVGTILKYSGRGMAWAAKQQQNAGHITMTGSTVGLGRKR